MEKRYYNGVSLFKVIAVMFIIAVHTRPGFDINETLGYVWVRMIPRVALSFFFMASGFLLANSVRAAKEAGKSGLPIFGKRIVSIVRLYAIWALIYFFLPANNDYYNNFISSGGTDMAGQTWLEYIRAFLLTGTYEHLWYIPAVVISMIVVYFLSYKNKGIVPFVLGIFVYAVFILGTSYKDIGQTTFLAPFLEADYFGVLRRIFGSGYFFVAIGYLFGNIDLSKLKKINLFTVIPLAILFFVEFSNRLFVAKAESTVITIVLPFLTASLLILASTLRFAFLDRSAKILSLVSSGMYFSHMLFMQIISTAWLMLTGLTVNRNEGPTTAYYFIVLAVSAGFSLIVYYVNEKKKFIRFIS